eukprot:gnl/TRDRNA2_/TRDRNA2_160294_c2_seq2.p2 gnl/TRDRNA2_/TRDRNA2_160294_c2~~gnl/TRDRNA2_/TRDRNA2_160294_c2_seq2.p2  ORF type:complete len:189 (-),score=32.71 gnl/TRDRNA2_/TRDRNA2_160294_c2_seq2:37-603(-)
MDEPLFDSLRTKQQIGYIVSCGVVDTHRVLGFYIRLQSSKFSPAEVFRSIEAFLVEFRSFVATLPDQDLERHICSLAARKLEPARSLGAVQSSAWSELQERSYLFDRRLHEAIELASVCREDVLSLFDRCIARAAPERRFLLSVAIGGRAKSTKAVEVEEIGRDYPGCRFVNSQLEFHREVELYECFV